MRIVEAAVILSICLLMGCARSSTIPLSADTVHITTAAAPICGAVGAQQVALRRAAIETINRGFDRFVIMGGAYQNNLRVVGHTPIIAQSTGAAVAVAHGGVASVHGQSRTFVYGGNPIIGGTHDQGLVVKMFREGDAGAESAVSARQQLGPKWKELAAENSATTC